MSFIPGTLSPYTAAAWRPRTPSAASPAILIRSSSLPQTFTRNFVLRPSFLASLMMTAAEGVVPPIHPKSAPLFFTESIWEFASIALSPTSSSPSSSNPLNPSSLAYALPPRLAPPFLDPLNPNLLGIRLPSLEGGDPVGGVGVKKYNKGREGVCQGA